MATGIIRNATRPRHRAVPVRHRDAISLDGVGSDDDRDGTPGAPTTSQRRRSTIMAIGVYFGASGMTSQQYDDVITKLQAAGVGSPKGRLSHTSFGAPNDLMVF